MPTIGIIQAGDQAMADRYSYLPSLGLTPAVLMLALDFSKRWSGKAQRLVNFTLALIVLAPLAALTYRQVGYWRSDEVLFTRSNLVTSRNFLAKSQLSQVARVNKNYELALALAEESKLECPGFAQSYDQAGLALQKLGRLKEAVENIREAILRDPTTPAFQNDAGTLMIDLDRPKDAIPHFQQALKLDPRFATSMHNLAIVLAGEGREDEALKYWEMALKIEPDNAVFPGWKATILRRKGDLDGAIKAYRLAVNSPDAKHDWIVDYVWILATSPNTTPGEWNDAIQFGKKSVEDSNANDFLAHDAYSAALARGGQFDAAVTEATLAQKLAIAAGKPLFASQVQARIDLYKSGQPYLARLHHATESMAATNPSTIPVNPAK